MLVNQSFAVGRVADELRHVAVVVGEVGGAAEVVGVEEEAVVLLLVVGYEAGSGVGGYVTLFNHPNPPSLGNLLMKCV